MTTETITQSAPPAGVPEQRKAPKKRRGKGRIVRRIITVVVVLALLAGAGGALWYFLFREKEEVGEIMTATAAISTIQSTVSGSGNARAGGNAALTTTAAGVVQEVFVAVGDQVYEGQPLYNMNSPEAEEQVAAAEKAIVDQEKNITSLERAIDTAEKAVKEREKDLEAAYAAIDDRREDVTRAEQEAREQHARLAALEAELAALKAGEAELTVTAPFAGKLIAVSPVTVGQNLAQGEELATLVNDRRFTLTLYISYAYQNSVQVGQAATVFIPAIMGSVPGTVEEIHLVNYISPEGASFFEAVIALDNPGTLTEKMPASATLTAPDGTPIYPYADGELAYYDTVTLRTAQAGSVREILALRQYTDVQAGQAILIQEPDELNKAIAAKEGEIETAREAAAAADKAVTDAQDAVVKASTEDIETARENIQYAQEDVEAARQAVVDGEARLEELKQALVTAQGNLLNFNAVAPISGTVTSCTIAEGQEVAGGTTVITISDTTNMIVEITVDDRNIPFVTPGMSVELSDYNGFSYIGTVTKIDMENSQMSGSSGMTNYPVTLTVENSSGSLLYGMWLEYSFVTSQSENCVTVPIQCVKRIVDTDGNPQDVVFLKAAERPDNAVDFEPPEDDPYSYGSSTKFPTPEEGYWPVPVVTGLNDRYNVEIVSGLNEGDEIFSAYMMTGAYSY